MSDRRGLSPEPGSAGADCGCQWVPGPTTFGPAMPAAKSTATSAKSASPAPVAGRAPKPGDHVFLVDGSGYIFRAYHALPPLSRKSDGLQLNAVYGFCNMLWKLLRDMKPEERPTHLAVVFDKSEKTFRTEMYPDYKAHRPDPPGDLIPQFPLVRKAVRCLRPAVPRTGRLRGRRPDRDLRPAGLRGGRHHHHRVVRQGPDAARERLRRHVRHHEGQEDRPRRGDREIRRAARQGDRGAGPDRRFDRQRAGRAGHRRQDRGAADRRIRRPRNAARARRRDQAGEAPADADRQCREGARLEEARHARRPREARRADRRSRGA